MITAKVVHRTRAFRRVPNTLAEHSSHNAIRSRVGDPATWAYSSAGGPSDQTTVTDNIKMVRFLVKYIEGDGSKGTHNPDYVQSMLDKAEDLLTLEGK